MQDELAPNEVDALVAQYMMRLDEGELLSPQEFMRENPEHQEALGRYFDDLGDLNDVFAGQASQTGFASTDLPESLSQVGDYVILEMIGRGGMGAVYKAWQPNLGRVIALKIMLRSDNATEKQIRRFVSEAESMATLNHPGIVRVYDVGEADGQHYFTMAFVDGTSLAERLREGPLPPREAAKLIADAADIIQFAHQCGVIHRDIKPGNILLDTDGRPHISDFGLAKRIHAHEELTVTGQVLGTPAFMPPEQARGEVEVDRSADIYALGAVLFCSLAGRAPFQAASPVDTLRQVMDEEAPSLRVLNHQLPQDLETICHKCLEKEPAKRYPSAMLLAEDLRRWLAGEPIVARPASMSERTIKWIRRKPAVAGLLAVSFFMMAAIGGIVVATFNNRQLAQAIRETDIARREAEGAFQQEASARTAIESAQKQLQQADYVRRIALARLEWFSGNTHHVDELLNGVPKEKRGWEWHLMSRLNHQESRTVEDAGVSSFTFSRDGNALFTGLGAGWRSTSGMVIQRDPATGARVHEFPANSNTNAVEMISNSDGSWLLVAMKQRQDSGPDITRVERWDATNGKVLQAYYEADFHVGFRGKIALSNDDKWFAMSLFEDRIEVWNVETGNRKYSLFDSAQTNSNTVDFSPDRALLAGAFSDGTVSIWRLDDGQLVQELSSESEAHGFGWVKFDPTGTRLALVFDSVIKTWDTNDWSELAVEQTDWTNTKVAFNNSGKLFAVASDRATIDIRQTDTGRLMSRPHGIVDLVGELGYSPNDTLVTVTQSGTMKFFDMNEPTGEPFVLHLGQPVQSLAFDADGTQLAVGGGTPQTGYVSVHDVTSGKQLFRGLSHLSSVRAVATIPGDDGLVTASWDHRVGLWESGSDRTTQFLHDGIKSGLEKVAVAPSGQWLVSSGGMRNHLYVWNLKERKVTHRLPLGKPDICPVAIHPDGRWLVSVKPNVGPVVFATDTWHQSRVLRLGDHKAWSLAFSRDGQFLAIGASSGVTFLFDFDTGRLVRTFNRHLSIVAELTFDLDGGRLATASYDGTVKVWDVATGDELLTLTGHVGKVHAVAFSPDGNLLATGGNDGTVRIYDGTPQD